MSHDDAVTVAASEWHDLRERLRSTRWATDWPVDGWDAGTESATLKRLVAYWADGFDWPAQQRAINDLPWAVATINGTPVRYLRFSAEEPDADDPSADQREGLPIILTNGWPSTAIEMVELARQLANPSLYGLGSERSHTVIVPALPGFPLSPQRPGLDEQTHEIWHTLMHDVLGFSKYVAHGGDLGAGITSRLAQAHPEAVAGIHLLAVSRPVDLDERPLTAAEQQYVHAEEVWAATEGAYQLQQQTRPLTLAPALADSPAGLLAWIVEKYRAWSDSSGDLSTRFTDDFLLTQASLYWFTNSISTSFRPYWEFAAGITERVRAVEVPTAVAVFPHDLAQPPREWAERTYNVVRYSSMPRGGHFAPHEEPELLSADIRAFIEELGAF